MDLKILKDMPPWEWPQGTDKMLLGILSDDQKGYVLVLVQLRADATIVCHTNLPNRPALPTCAIALAPITSIIIRYSK